MTAPDDVDTGDADLTDAERDVVARVGLLHDVDVTAMAAVANVYRVASAVRNHMEREVLGPDRLTFGGFTAMFVLWVWGEQESSRLAENCGVHRATMSGVVTTLERRGLVKRRDSTEDRRVVLVSLTELGMDTITRLFPRFNEQEALVTKRLSDDDRRSLAHLLREVLRSVDAI